MVIKNLTKNKVITKDAKFAEFIIDKSLGLLKKGSPKTLIFKTRFGIYTFFLKEPIEIVVLDKDLKVVKLKESLKPNRLFFWNPKYFWIIELVSGSINKSKIQKGDLLKFNW